MRKNATYLLILAGAVALIGAGCVGQNTMPSDSASDADAIDAAIDAEINAAADIDTEESKASSDVDVVESDKPELNSLNEMQYDLP